MGSWIQLKSPMRIGEIGVERWGRREGKKADLSVLTMGAWRWTKLRPPTVTSWA